MQQRASQEPRNAQLNYMLAVLYAKAGNAKSAVEQLERLTRSNWTLGLDLADFTAIQGDPSFRAVAARLRAGQAQQRSGSVSAKLNQRGFAPLGLAWDQSRNRFYFSAAPKSEVFAAQSNGSTQALRLAGASGGLAPFGMRVEPDGKTLWVATAAVKEMQGYSQRMAGRSSLVAINLQTGKVMGTFESGDANNPSAFRDVQPLGDGRRAIVADAARGTLFIASLGKNAMAPLLPAHSFEQPRALAYDPVGERIFIADSLGLSVMGSESSRFRRLPSPAGAYLGGVTGLRWWKGNLVAVQSELGALRIWRVPVSGDTLAPLKMLSAGDERLGAVRSIATNSNGLWLVTGPQLLGGKSRGGPLQLFHIPL